MEYKNNLGEGINANPEYNGLQQIKEETIDELEKYELTEEDKKIIEEQNKTGSEIEQFMKKELLLRKYAKDFPIEDYSMILYRLPLTEYQMETIYNNLTNKK